LELEKMGYTAKCSGGLGASSIGRSISIIKSVPAFPLEIVSEKPPAVLVVVTVNTEILPVGAVRWVVPAIAVFMVHSKKIPVFEFKLSPAFGADQAVDFQGLFSIIGGNGGTLF
jgi:hypothetical protein